jgi:hypothetical protein
MKKLRYLFLSVLLISSCQTKERRLFVDGLEAYPTLKKVLEDSSKYQVQILYTQIDRNEHVNPMMTTFQFNLNDERYFYPASTVKLPIALLALEWLEAQNIEGLTAETIMLTDSIRPSQFSALVDSNQACRASHITSRKSCWFQTMTHLTDCMNCLVRIISMKN